MDISTTYGNGGATTKTESAPIQGQGPDDELRAYYREIMRRSLQNSAQPTGPAPAQPAPKPTPWGANPVQPTAIPGTPSSGVIYHPQQQQAAPRAAAQQGSHSFGMMAGANQGGTMDWIPTSYQPRAVYTGWDPTGGAGGGVQFNNTPGQAHQDEAYRKAADDDDFARFQRRSKEQQNVGHGLNPDGSKQGGQF